MRKLTLLLTFSVLIFNPVSSQSISDLLNGYFAYNRFWGNVLVVQNGKVIFEQCYGYADKENNIRNDASKVFNLASVSKTLTAAAIYKLHDEGRLSIFDRADKYLPGIINDKTDSLTILNLLNHTSGIASHPNQEIMEKEGLSDRIPVNLKQMVSLFNETKLKNKPGTTFEYNNYNYIFLAYIVEKVTGMDFFNYLNRAILSEAGMDNTFSQLNLPGTEAIGHVGIGTTNNLPVNNPEHPSWYKGGAGIYSNAEDLLTFLQSLFTHQLFSEKTLNLMLDSCVRIHRGNISWTPGWQKNEVDGVSWFSHGGSIEGFSARIGYVTEENISIVILSNLVKDYKTEGISSVNFSFVDDIADNIIRILHGKTVSCLPLPTGKPDKKHTGKYRLDESHFIDLSHRNDSLFLTTGINPNFTLFDYYLNRDITDTSANYRICKSFTSALLCNDFDGFEKYSTEQMQRIVFNQKDISKITDFWQMMLTRAGKYISSNIYDKTRKTDYTDYLLAYHLEEADVIMQISFNDDGLINGFYILKLIPRSHIHTVNLVPTGKNEYFVDGYRYGWDNDFRIKYNESEKSLYFHDDNVSFTAFKVR